MRGVISVPYELSIWVRVPGTANGIVEGLEAIQYTIQENNNSR